MGLLQTLFAGREAYDPEEDELAKPDVREAADLVFHVDRCGKRYGQLRRGYFRVEAKQDRILGFLVLMLLVFGADKLGVLHKLLTTVGLPVSP